MKTIMLVAALTTLAGCGAATPVPADKVARAQEAVRRAEESPAAAADPKALAHLQLAKNQLAYARKLMVEGRNADARWVLMRAESDAETAFYLAQAQAARGDAQQTIDAIRQAMSLMQGGSGS